ncbi:MAG: Phosphate acyltransferase [Parachlamydiales bacterium]|nr:Phosphate acyltransferase [Parachlamydiales bacterium]
MRKNQKICQPAPIAAACACRIASALAAVITTTGPSMPRKAEVRIGIDLMGSENSPDVLLKTATDLASTLPPHVKLVAIGTPALASRTDLPFIHATETIEMDDAPLTAIRRKRDSSLCVGLKALKEQRIDAFVSAGNTGALVSCAKMTLSMIPGLLRPALLALMPTRRTPLAVLDVGANVQCKTEHLVQFALIGSAYQRARGVALPSVGLLNIGSEAMKGTSEIRLAYQEMQRLSLLPNPLFRFAGNIEGKVVFDGNIDVLVTDGFTGNVFLKTAEGLASLILDRLNENLPPDILAQMQDQLLDLQRHLHYAEYPGALLCGIRGIVIKCHGYSSPQAFASGVREAIRIASEGFLQILQNKLLAYSTERK